MLIKRSISYLGTTLAILLGIVACACSSASQMPQRSITSVKLVAFASATAFAVLDESEKLRRIKLTGVDAPERRQRFALQARRFASEWLGTGPVNIAIDSTDQDRRIHGRVSVDGRDLGLVLIEAGFAWCDPSDQNQLPTQLRQRYSNACRKAKAERRGLWQDPNPYPPWEYRKIPEFDPLPGSAQPRSRSCRQVGNETLQCDDGTTYRNVGSRIVGSDGVTYSKRGNTITGTDGSRFEQQGNSLYGADGSVCRARGRRLDCY